MVKIFTQLQRYIRGSSRGFTLIELLVALIVGAIVLGLALQLIVGQRQLFVKAQTRTQVNQNLRAAIDIVSTDIKQAGERLAGNTQLPVVQVFDGGTGAPDRLLMQRKIIDDVLPLCQSISSSTRSITVSVDRGLGNPPSTSCPFSNGNAAGDPTATPPVPPDPWPDNLEQWRKERCKKDGIEGCNRTTNVATDGCVEQGGTDRECLWAYIYDSTNNRGEFFLYTFEDSRLSGSETQYRIYRASSSTTAKHNWQNNYTASTATNPNPANPGFYILEQRCYRLANNNNLPGDKVLELLLNERNCDQSQPLYEPIRLVNQLSDFQVKVWLPTTTTAVDNFNTTIPYDNKWQQIRSIQVDLKDRNSSKTISSQLFPRNAASKDNK